MCGVEFRPAFLAFESQFIAKNEKLEAIKKSTHLAAVTMHFMIESSN